MFRAQRRSFTSVFLEAECPCRWKDNIQLLRPATAAVCVCLQVGGEDENRLQTITDRKTQQHNTNFYYKKIFAAV